MYKATIITNKLKLNLTIFVVIHLPFLLPHLSIFSLNFYYYNSLRQSIGLFFIFIFLFFYCSKFISFIIIFYCWILCCCGGCVWGGSLVFSGMKVVLFVSFRGCFVCFYLLFIFIFKKCVCCWSVCVCVVVVVFVVCGFFCSFFCVCFLGGLSKKKRACATIRFSVC